MDLQEAMRVATEARAEGAQAARDGKRRNNNPYSPFEDELQAAAWDDGYSRAAWNRRAGEAGDGVA